MRTTILLAVLASLAACQRQSEEAARESPGSVRAEIDRIRNEWQTAAERDDAAAVAQLFAKDAVVIDPIDYAPVQGREAIQRVLTEELPIVNRLELRSPLRIKFVAVIQIQQFPHAFFLVHVSQHMSLPFVFERRRFEGVMRVLRRALVLLIFATRGPKSTSKPAQRPLGWLIVLVEFVVAKPRFFRL